MYFYLYAPNRIINLDGTVNHQGVSIEYPHDYFFGTGTVVNGELHLFGGRDFNQMIFKLEGCSFKATGIETNIGFDEYSASLAINDGTSALICFERSYGDSRQCEIFDGKTVNTTISTNHTHGSGSLGFYKGQPAAFGTEWTDCCTGARKIELFNDTTEWVELQDHPYDMAYVTLVGLENGALLSMGGKFNVNDKYPWSTHESLDIWILEDNVWSLLGQLERSMRSSAISIVMDSYVYVFAQKITRIEIVNNKILEKKDLGYSDWPEAYLDVDPGFCLDPGYYSYN